MQRLTRIIKNSFIKLTLIMKYYDKLCYYFKCRDKGAYKMLESLTATNKNTIAKQDVADLYEQYTNYIDASPKTIATYTGNLKQFIFYLQQNGISEPTREDVIAFRESLKDHCKPTTIQNYIEAVKVFFNWTEDSGLYPNIAKHVKGVKLSKEHRKDFLLPRQVQEVLGKVDLSTLQGKRDFVVLGLMVTGGLRDVEIHRANIEDLQTLNQAPVLYIQGKGRQDTEDYIKIPLTIYNVLQEYLGALKQDNKQAPLFVSLSKNSLGNRLSLRSISGIAKQYMRMAGYDSQRLTAHSLRHSAVTILLLEGKTLQEAQQFARHTNINTTEIYAHNLDRATSNNEQVIANTIFKKGNEKL